MISKKGIRDQAPPLFANEGVTLFHFTSKRAAQKISAQGLRANWVSDMPVDFGRGMRGVWLSDDPQLPPMCSASAERRLEVVVGQSDTRLIHWRSLYAPRMTRSQLAAIDLECPMWKSFFFYSGDIDPINIRGCERYATLAQTRECRRAHLVRLAELGIE